MNFSCAPNFDPKFQPIEGMQSPSDLTMDNFSEDGGENSTQFLSSLQIQHTLSEDDESNFSVVRTQLCNFSDGGAQQAETTSEVSIHTVNSGVGR